MIGREQRGALRELFYGCSDAPSQEEAEASWKAVKALVARAGGLREPARRCLAARMAAAGASPEVIEGVESFDVREALPALLLANAGSCRCAVPVVLYEALSVLLFAGELAPEELEAVRAVAASADLPPSTVDGIAELCREEAALRLRRVDLLASGRAAGPRYDLL